MSGAERRLLAREWSLSAVVAAVSRRRAPLARAARRRSRGARVPAHVPAPARLRGLEQLLVRGALLVRHLQLHLLPARGGARDQAARDRARSAPRRSRSRSSSGRSGGRRRGSRAGRSPMLWPGIVLSAAFPFALGDDVRAARDRRAAARPPTQLRGAALPDAAREPARAAAARARARRRCARADRRAARPSS